VFERGEGELADWEILLEIAERLGGGATGRPAIDRLFRIGKRFGFGWTPERMAALSLRAGRYGDSLLPWRRGLTRKQLEASPHGVDLGPLEPGAARRIFHADKRVHVDAPPLLDALRALARDTAQPPPADELLLIGRREIRTNNSWMHNVPAMVAGRERCTLLVHPDDALRAGVADGEVALLESRVHRGQVAVHVSDEMRPGVVSLPHGWGHTEAAPWQRVAASRPGVSANDWTDDQLVESVVGQSVLNGVPVRLHRMAAAAQPASAS
jgi:anaerobic selenocysteine-containing dehydrogenase